MVLNRERSPSRRKELRSPLIQPKGFLSFSGAVKQEPGHNPDLPDVLDEEWIHDGAGALDDNFPTSSMPTPSLFGDGGKEGGITTDDFSLEEIWG